MLPVLSSRNAFSLHPSPGCCIQLYNFTTIGVSFPLLLRDGIPWTCAVHSLYSCTWQPGACTSKFHSSFQAEFKCHSLPEASSGSSSELPLPFAVSVLEHLSFLYRVLTQPAPCPPTKMHFPLAILSHNVVFFSFMAFILICN